MNLTATVEIRTTHAWSHPWILQVDALVLGTHLGTAAD